MKLQWFLIIGLVFLGVLCLCSAAEAFSITGVKVAGQPLQYHTGAAYTTRTVIPRLTFTKNPTVTFTVDWTDHHIVGDDGRVYDTAGSPDPTLRYFANIAIGSAGELYNSKGVWLGWETGNYKQAATSFTMNDPWYGPFTKTSLKKGDWYVESIPLTPGVTTYTYTLQNPDVLCFDAHRYAVYIWAAGYPEPTQYYAFYDGPEWDFTSGDNSDDSGNTIYGSSKVSQEFYVTTAFDFTYPELKVYRIGVIPPGATLTCSLYKGDKTYNWKPSGAPLWTSWTWNSSYMNLIPTGTGAYVSFYQWATTYTRLSKDTSYVLVLSSTGCDNTHKIGWRKDTGNWGFPHYTKGFLSWCYSATSSGSTWSNQGDTFMFGTNGVETTPSTTIGNMYFQADIGWFDSRTFVLNTYGPTVDRTSAYDPWFGYDSISHFVLTTQNSGKITSVFFGNMNPAHLKLTAGDVISTGATFDTAAVVSDVSWNEVYTDRKIPVTVVLCDKDRNILDYAVVDSYLPILGTFPFKPYGPSLTIGTLTTIAQFRLLQYSVGAKKLEPRTAYYVYLGIPIGTYTMSNLYISTDDTMKSTNWSASVINIGGLVSPDASKTYDYMGAYVYFETQPAYTDKSAPGAFRTTPSWVTNLVIWCSNSPPDGLGLPWVAVLIGFMPAILIVGLLFSFMRKWSISLPSYVYSLAASAGIYISWQVGLLALWIMVLIIASLVFVSMFQFREPISQALQTVGALKSSSALSSLSAKERRQEMLSSSGSARRMLNKRRDQGVLPAKQPKFNYNLYGFEDELQQTKILTGQSANGKEKITIAAQRQKEKALFFRKKNNQGVR